MRHPAARRRRLPRRLTAAVLAAVTVLLFLGTGAGAVPVTARLVSPAVFDRDVIAATAALGRYGAALREVERPADLRSVRPVLDRQVRAFDRRIARLGGYRLRDAALDRRRAHLVRTGPPVAGALHRFNDAAADGDLAAMARIVPVVRRRIVTYLRAAGG